MTDQQRLYASATGWEDAVDSENEKKRIAAFIAAHCKCRDGHIREQSVEQCPTCGGWSSYIITESDVPKPESLR